MGVPDIVASSRAATIVFVTFNAAAIYSVVPLNSRMLQTIRDKKSLYFRAMIISSWGLCLRTIAQTMRYADRESVDVPWYVTTMMSQIGWIGMVSGFALVLWSRLGFILGSVRVRKYLLWLIIFNGLTFHTIMTVCAATAKHWRVQSKPAAARFLEAQRVFECIQIVAFNGQEILISSMYIRAAYVYLRDWSQLGSTGARGRVRRTMILLLVCQAVIVCIDIAIISIDLMGMLRVKNYIHSFIYCVKLEVELVVLNQLVEISKLGVPGLPSTESGNAHADATPAGATADEQEGWVETVNIFCWRLKLRMRAEVKNPCAEKQKRRPRLQRIV